MTRSILLLALVLSQMSCQPTGQNQDTEKVMIFYGIIHASLLSNKALQQKLIDESTNDITILEKDNNAIIDTKELADQLDSAKKSTEAQLLQIIQLKEVDNEIGYKDKVVTYLTLVNSAYSKEFVDFIDLLNSKVDDKSRKAAQILNDKVLAIEAAAKDCRNARQEFIEKYDIQETNEIDN